MKGDKQKYYLHIYTRACVQYITAIYHCRLWNNINVKNTAGLNRFRWIKNPIYFLLNGFINAFVSEVYNFVYAPCTFLSTISNQFYILDF